MHDAPRLCEVHSSRARMPSAGPCRGHAPAVLKPCGRPCSRPRRPYRGPVSRAPARISDLLQVTIQHLYRKLSPCHLPYRSPGCVVSQHSQRPYLSAPCHDTINCIVTRPQPGCLLVKIQGLYRDTTTQRPSHAPVTIQSLYRDTPHPVKPPPVTIQSDCIVTCSPANYTLSLLCHDTISIVS